MSGVQARSGRRQLRKLDRTIAHRRHMRALYDHLLAERGWAVAGIPETTNPVLVRYPEIGIVGPGPG